MAERYRLDALLGRGGMGEVWRAWDELLLRPVALKLLAEYATDDEALVTRFEREARTAAQLNDPHLVSVYDFGTSGDHCFLIMELVEGRNLAEELRRRGPLPAEEVVQIANQAAAGLVAAHEHGVVHRDVKPSNLVLDAAGTVKITDFGIAKGLTGTTSAHITQTGALMGTSLYIAPETALGQAAGTASDIYSLGCTLYELLTGTPPFVADNPLAVLRLHIEGEPRLVRPDVPSALAAYLLAMLAKDPQARPSARQAADWFATNAWREADATGLSSGISATPQAPLAETTPQQVHPQAARSRRGRHLIAGATLAAAALTAAGLALAPSSADGTAPPAPPGAASRPSHQDVKAPPGSSTSRGGGTQQLPSHPQTSGEPEQAPTHRPATRSSRSPDFHSTPATKSPNSVPSSSPSTIPPVSPPAEPTTPISPTPTASPTRPSVTPTPPSTTPPSEKPTPSSPRTGAKLP